MGRAKKGNQPIHVIVLVKSTADAEKGLDPKSPETQAMMTAMGKYNEELIAAGILKPGACDGLKPSAEGKRIAFDGASRTVIDGPFANPRELVSGFWLWEVKDMAEAVAS